MRNNFYPVLCVLLSCISLVSKAQVKIGDNPNSINPNSLVELEGANKGFVFSRVSIIDINSSAPLAADLLAGTVVYNTNVSIAGGSGAGLYVWNGLKWTALDPATALNGSWQLTGNTSTNSGLNFLGSTDSAGLSFRTANTEAVHIDSLQNVGINVPNTTYKFEESGTFRIHTDSFNIMSDPDIFPGFIPGIQFAGAVKNADGSNVKIINGVVNVPAGNNNRKIIKAVNVPGGGGNGGDIAVMGTLDPVNQTQDIVSAQTGSISMNSSAANSSSNIDLQNTGELFINTNQGNDSNNNIQLSANGINLNNNINNVGNANIGISSNGINLNHNVNNVGNSNINLNDSTLNFNANENITNKNTGISVRPADYSVFNNDNNNNRNSNFSLNSTNYNLNVSDNNLQTSSGQSATTDNIQFNVRDNLNNLNSNYRMDSTLSLSINSLNQNSGIDFKAENTNIYKNDFTQNLNSNFNLSANSLNLNLNSPSNNSNFIMSNGSASFTSNNNFKLSIGQNNPQANLDVAGTIRSSNLFGGGVVMADNNGILYVSSTGTKNVTNYAYSISGGTTVPGGTINLSGSGDYSAGVLEIIVTLPNSLASNRASVSVSPDNDLPNNISIASARLMSNTQVKIRLLNHGTVSQSLFGQLFITINEF